MRDAVKELNFQEAKEIIISGRLHLLGRSMEQQVIYDKFYDELLLNWETPGDYILAEKFRIPYDLNFSTGKNRVLRPFPLGMKKCLENDFPYNFDPNTRHFILWKLDGEVTNEDISTEVQLLKKIYNTEDFATYINPEHLKSIPEIAHAHIIFQVINCNSKRGRLVARGAVAGFVAVTVIGGIFTGAVLYQLRKHIIFLLKPLEFLLTIRGKFFKFSYTVFNTVLDIGSCLFYSGARTVEKNI